MMNMMIEAAFNGVAAINGGVGVMEIRQPVTMSVAQNAGQVALNVHITLRGLKAITGTVMEKKLYDGHDWKWFWVSLSHIDMEYLRKNWEGKKAAAPVLEKRHHKYFLRFSYTEEMLLTKAPAKEQIICRKIAGAVTGYAEENHADVIVFEYLETKGKISRRKKQKLHLWKKD